jgi:hypothetical protein
MHLAGSALSDSLKLGCVRWWGKSVCEGLGEQTGRQHHL